MSRFSSRNGVAVDRVRVSSAYPTARTDIATLPDGDRQFVFEDFGACAHYRPTVEDLMLLRGARAVHVGWLNFVDDLKHALRDRRGLLSQDLSVNNAAGNLTPAGLDVAFISAPPERAEEEARRLLSGGAPLAVVTSGAAGSLATDGRDWRRSAASAIDPVDTTGAGDAFIASFIDAHLAGSDLGACLSRATTAAAQACLHHGGFPQSPLDVRMVTSAGTA